jgi:hypothetical protein
MGSQVTRAARTVAKEIADLLDDKRNSANHLGLEDTFCLKESKLQRWLLVLCPPRKRKAVSKGTKARRASVRELDALCREVVFLRDGGKCRKCGKSSGLMDWAHVYSRRFRVTRWEPLNSMVLCRGCHMRWHHSPPEMVEWWRVEMGPMATHKLDVMKRAAKCGPLELIKLKLEQEKAKLA